MARKYKQGKYLPMNPQKYVGDVNDIVFRSSYEKVLFQFLDKNPAVKHWNSESVVVEYWSEIDKRMRRYFVDICATIVYQDGTEKTFLIEVKPYSQTIPPKRGRKKEETWLEEVYTWEVNKAKWQAAEKWCKKNNIEFKIFTEYDLGIALK